VTAPREATTIAVVRRERPAAVTIHRASCGMLRHIGNTPIGTVREVSTHVLTRDLVESLDLPAFTRLHVCLLNPRRPPHLDTGRCRVCGCTNDRACLGGCWWVGLDLCSACQ
jgi:hypothetical protein